MSTRHFYYSMVNYAILYLKCLYDIKRKEIDDKLQ